MISVKRLEEITKILEKEGSVDVNSLCEKFNVTGKTVRQDLAKLEEMGLLERFHGGAVLKQNGTKVYPIKQRKMQNIEEKRRIAGAALQYAEDRDIIILDGGSTNLELAKLLGYRFADNPIIVITNDLIIAGELHDKENVTLYVTGGKLRREGAYTLLGRDAERMIQKYNANKVFLGTSAVDFNEGLTVFSAEEAEIKRAMVNSARMVICLADYSKFHQLAFTTFASLDDVDVLITDDRISNDDRAFLDKHQIKLEIV